jgi:hypothetical protein
MESEEATYTKCLGCDHFVIENDEWSPDLDPANWYQGIMPDRYEHLDDGDKEHNHPAEPSNVSFTLAQWALLRPELFRTFMDGSIGPNSRYYPDGLECDHYMTHGLETVTASTEPRAKGMGYPVRVECFHCEATIVFDIGPAYDAARWSGHRGPLERRF